MRWFFLLLSVVVLFSCGATFSRDISDRIIREAPDWQEDGGLQPWLDEEEEENNPPIARLAPEWVDEEGQPNLPSLRDGGLPVARENPY